jgi:hypothetical protein
VWASTAGFEHIFGWLCKVDTTVTAVEIDK